MATKRIDRNAGKKVAKKAAAKKPKKPRAPKIRTAAENAGGSPGSLAEKLSKAFSLTSCKRLVAIGEERNRALSRLAELAESKKAVNAELNETKDTPERKRLAYQKLIIEEEQDKLKQIKLTSVQDVFRLIMECAGGTLFEAAEEALGAAGTGGDDGKGGIFDGEDDEERPGVKANERMDAETGEVTRTPRQHANGSV